MSQQGRNDFTRRYRHQSDAGMCGDYNSVIGMENRTDAPIYYRHVQGALPCRGPATLSGLFVETEIAQAKHKW